MTYKASWWSVDLPTDWRGYPDAGCSTFRADPPLGVLQISAARKDAGIVTDQELKEFAESRLGREVTLRNAAFGNFAGLTAAYRKDGLFWEEWWLKAGCLMVYVTYNVVESGEAVEQAAITRILGSLKGIDTV
jgi:hypothetical protein